MIIPKRVIDELRHPKVIRPTELYISKMLLWFVIGLLFAVGLVGLNDGVWVLGLAIVAAGLLAYSLYKTDRDQGYIDAMYTAFNKNRHLDQLENDHKATERPKNGGKTVGGR